MAIVPQNRKSLLSSQARVQAPWVKVTIGTNFTFGVFSKVKGREKDDAGFYTSFNVQYPNYVRDLTIVKINGQVNQYTLNIIYPIRPGDDPNFFEKVFSSASSTRRIVFSYGDASMPNYCYKDEEAIITKVQQTFNLEGSSITYTVSAISATSLGSTGNFTFMNSGFKKPSAEIIRILKDPRYGLYNLFPGMKNVDPNLFIDGSDKEVELDSKTNISPIDYISYLVGCMIPVGSTRDQISKDIYILTIHDETVYDKSFSDTMSQGGPYFKVTRTSYNRSYSDAYEIDVGYNTSTVVKSFAVSQNENYSILYDYAGDLYKDEYIKRLNNQGMWEDVYAPTFTSGNAWNRTRAEDIAWYTKLTKYPIKATITVLGLLRPATLMQYIRLNVIFPGGGKHISSGLYIVTKQTDKIDSNGYYTTLELTKISGDDFATN